MKAISCGRCKAHLGELASGSRVKTGSIHLCETCGKLIVAEAFKNQGGKEDLMDVFARMMNGGK